MRSTSSAGCGTPSTTAPRRMRLALSVNSAPEWHPAQAGDPVKTAIPRISFAVSASARPSKKRSTGASSEMRVIS